MSYPLDREVDHLLNPHRSDWGKALAGLQACEQDWFTARLKRFAGDLFDGFSAVYGERAGFQALRHRLLVLLAGAFADRPKVLRKHDLERSMRPDWFQDPHIVGYVAYADRFGGDLKGVRDHLDYLSEMGVNYLHLMPLLKTREDENDGGYAVTDYREIDPAVGDLRALEGLSASLRQRGISLCLDLVINHVAREHPWAVAARARDPRYQAYFHMFEDRVLPDAYERSLPEVFPEAAPGNFTWDRMSGRWVWTTFNSYQWDLNWTNPEVFFEFLEIIFFLAAKGVDIFRLDAIAFIWKRLGTDCQNQPEVHAITQVLRAAVRIVAPAVVFKAEAIVGPQQLAAYLGVGDRAGKVSDLAYHNSLMVQIWSSLASRDTRLMTQALRVLPEKPPSTSWTTYLRCHDDIGWAIDDQDAAAVGLSGEAHRRFLSDYYAGFFPGSHARGLVFQENPKTGDRRISGTAASLAGLELALERDDAVGVGLSIERLLLGYALVLGFGGVPLIYMGDELAMLNDYDFVKEEGHQADNRWVHRPRMDWAKAARRLKKGTLEQRVFTALKRLIQARKSTPQLCAATPVWVEGQDNPHLFAYTRPHPTGPLVAVYNFSEEPQGFSGDLLLRRGITNPFERIESRAIALEDRLWLPPYARMWLTHAG